MVEFVPFAIRCRVCRRCNLKRIQGQGILAVVLGLLALAAELSRLVLCWQNPPVAGEDGARSGPRVHGQPRPENG